ncbi:NIPSNAP family protein [Chryseomicrobium palamuruense]|uniref:NIPSNAP family protein n=1 Tax=Chryseomicrobium palamuruense TaxID=682973 RepID=A0ABV8UW93_9BACL
MFYRRKFYHVRNEIVEAFNELFNTINLPNQLKHGARLVGRWMVPVNEDVTEVFAIWEYESYEAYIEIEEAARADEAHVARVNDWYTKQGGKAFVHDTYFVDVRNEKLINTVNA